MPSVGSTLKFMNCELPFLILLLHKNTQTEGMQAFGNWNWPRFAPTLRLPLALEKPAALRIIEPVRNVNKNIHEYDEN